MQMEGSSNLTVMFFKWWYGEALRLLLRYLKAAYIVIADAFSAKICLQTLFAPWKRDVASYQNLTLQQRFQVWTLNLASRLIGAIVKILTLITFMLVAIIITLLSLAIILVWLLYPGIIAYLIYLLVTGR